MSSPTGKRDVIRLRTFAEDVERVRGEKGIEGPITKDILPNEVADTESKGVLKKIKKKSLDLQEQNNQGTELDSDGVSFDEETAAKVVDQSYEANKSVAEEATEKQADVDIKAESIGLETPQAKKSAADFLGLSSDEPSASEQTGQVSEAVPVVKPKVASKELKDIKAVPASLLGDDHGKVHELTSEEVGGGEIVSDKKRDRFKLFPAIGTAMSDWVGETKEKIEKATEEKHTIEKTEQRIETIKAAAQPKTIAPEEDFAQVAERLSHTEKKTTNDAPVLLKPKLQEEAQWTHTIPEEGEEVKEVAEPTPEPEPEPAITPPPPQPAAPEPAPVAAPAPAAAAEPVTPVVPEAIAAMTTTSEPVVSEIKDANYSAADLASIAGIQPEQPAVQPGELASQAHQQIAQEESTREVVKQTVTSRGFSLPSLPMPSLSKSRELLPSPTFALIVVLVAIVSGIGTSMYFFWQPNEVATVPAATTNPLFTAQLQADVAFDSSHASTMNLLLSAVNSTPGSLYLYFTRDGGQTIVPPGELMTFLAPQAPGSFTRSVNNVSFGSLDNQPFIVLQVSNFDNAFSGMLAWEQTMSADLSPLFGPIVTESLDSQARTSTQTRGAFFKDIVASNLSGRLLVNERGEDRILYAFLDKQTIVITTDRLTLGNILPLIR